jgi:hypothetical protein
MAQLMRGARQALELINAELDAIDDVAIDNPAAVRKLVRRIKERLREEIEPRLYRANADTSLEVRVALIEEQIRQLLDK